MSKRIIKGVSFVGTPIGMKRRVLDLVATIEELEYFHTQCCHNRQLNLEIYSLEYEQSRPKRAKKCEVQSKKRYYRQLWRSRYSDQIKSGLYKTCKKYKWYDYYETLNGGEGVMQNSRYRGPLSSLPKDSLLMFSHRDEVGNVHFVTCVNNRTIGFKRGSAQVDSLERVADA
jgi:hypothetical protein